MHRMLLGWLVLAVAYSSGAAAQVGRDWGSQRRAYRDPLTGVEVVELTEVAGQNERPVRRERISEILRGPKRVIRLDFLQDPRHRGACHGHCECSAQNLFQHPVFPFVSTPRTPKTESYLD